MIKKNIKNVSLFILVGVIFFPICFAAEGESSTITQSISNGLHLLISILSRVRVLIAALAGKLLTNDIVYGEFIHLDQALWKIRNITKNLSNFALGFIFLRTVVKFVMEKSGDIKEIVKKIGYFVLAGIGINLSWLMIGGLIDISTILSASMGSFPSMILSKEHGVQQSLEGQKIYLPQKMVLNLNPENKDEPFYENIRHTETYTGQDLGEFIDSIVPTSNSLAGPLIYLGVSIFHFQDYLTNEYNMAGQSDVSDLITTFLIKFGMLLFFTIALILMLVFNVIRIFYIRLLIVFSPLLIAFWAFKKGNTGVDELKLVENATLGNLIKLIFVPVIYIVYMGITLILIVTMQKMILGNELKKVGKTNVSISNNKLGVGDSSFSINGSLRPNRKKDTQTTFADIFIMVLSIALLYGMTYLISKTTFGIGGTTMSNMKKLQDNVLRSIPIGSTSIGGVRDGGDEILSGISAPYMGNEKIGKQGDELMEKLGFKGDGLSGEKKARLNQLANAKTTKRRSKTSNTFLDEYKSTINDAKYKNGKSFNNDGITSGIDNWLGNEIRGDFNSGYKHNREQLLYNISDNAQKENVKKIRDSLGKDGSISSLNDLVSKIDSKFTGNTKKTLLQNLFNELTGSKNTSIIDKTTFMKAKR